MNCDAKMHIKNKTDVNWSKTSFYCLPYLSQIGKSTANAAKSNTKSSRSICKKKKNRCDFKVAYMDLSSNVKRKTTQQDWCKTFQNETEFQGAKDKSRNNLYK